MNNYNTIFFGNTTTSGAAITASITFTAARHGHRLLIAWVAKGNNATNLKVDISNSSSVTATSEAFVIGPAGNDRRYLTFGYIGDNILLYYCGAPLSKWITNTSSGVTYTN